MLSDRSRSNSGTYSCQRVRSGFLRLVDSVCSEEGNAALRDGLVFFWSSCLSIAGCEFGKIRTDDDERIMTARVDDLLALRAGTIHIGLLAVLVQRDRNQRPSANKSLVCWAKVGKAELIVGPARATSERIFISFSRARWLRA